MVDTRPASARLNLTDASEVDKWEMPPELYEKRTDSVLAWKKRQQLGRFDPSRQQQLDEQERLEHEAELMWRVVHDRAIEVGKRCRVGEDRRGVVRFVGPVPEIPNGGVWVGFEADEPTGELPISSSCSRLSVRRVLMYCRGRRQKRRLRRRQSLLYLRTQARLFCPARARRGGRFPRDGRF